MRVFHTRSAALVFWLALVVSCGGDVQTGDSPVERGAIHLSLPVEKLINGDSLESASTHWFTVCGLAGPAMRLCLCRDGTGACTFTGGTAQRVTWRKIGTHALEIMGDSDCVSVLEKVKGEVRRGLYGRIEEGSEISCTDDSIGRESCPLPSCRREWADRFTWEVVQGSFWSSSE